MESLLKSNKVSNENVEFVTDSTRSPGISRRVKKFLETSSDNSRLYRPYSTEYRVNENRWCLQVLLIFHNAYIVCKHSNIRVTAKLSYQSTMKVSSEITWVTETGRLPCDDYAVSLHCAKHTVRKDRIVTKSSVSTDTNPNTALDCRTLWRRIQTEGLSGEYLEEENTELRSQFHFLVALAFVPENDVVHAFDILQENVMDELTPIFDYFEDNYVMDRRHGREDNYGIIETVKVTESDTKEAMTYNFLIPD
ncbi:hypothetical protein ANN_04407 [Periplaneta americana]|uniref:Uncharacterized protein n=1 Tax=Periplaneta americana TaxID=6978 RepID=A0ABQ8T8H0_PERAM|nr:hypothetical protein ANN_04407 [Periplaneta americana]